MYKMVWYFTQKYVSLQLCAIAMLQNYNSHQWSYYCTVISHLFRKNESSDKILGFESSCKRQSTCTGSSNSHA